MYLRLRARSSGLTGKSQPRPRKLNVLICFSRRSFSLVSSNSHWAFSFSPGLSPVRSLAIHLHARFVVDRGSDVDTRFGFRFSIFSNHRLRFVNVFADWQQRLIAELFQLLVGVGDSMLQRNP